MELKLKDEEIERNKKNMELLHEDPRLREQTTDQLQIFMNSKLLEILTKLDLTQKKMN